MALVTHNGNTYNYVYMRVCEDVLRLYSASGHDALELQARDDENRRQRQETRRAQAEIEDHHRQAGRIEKDRGQSLATLVRVGLEAYGFARYSRNPWKRRLMRALPSPAVKTAKKRLTAKIRAEIREAVDNLVHSRASGAIDRLQALARDFPDAFESEVKFDVVRLGRSILADKASADDTKLRDDLLARMQLVSADLAGPNPSPALRLCAEVASFAWAETWLLAIVVGATATGGTEQSLQASKRLQGAQRRLLAALRTHAQIRALEGERPRRERPKGVDAAFKVIE